MLTRRFMLAAGGVAPLGIAAAARAQSRPTASQLDRLIARVLKTTDTVTMARPEALGFVNVAVVTRQLGLVSGDMLYYFCVTDPRLKDGLIFYSNEAAARTYRVHRTDTHLTRVASVVNDLKLGVKGLTTWDGPPADTDFNAHLAFWATVK